MPIFWKMLLLYQVRHKLYWHSQVQVHQWTICCSWTHRQGGAAQLGLRHKQHPFICLYRHWVPPDSLAKTDTQQPAGDGKDERNTSGSNGDVLFLSGMNVALRAFRGQAVRSRGWGRCPQTMESGGNVSSWRGPALCFGQPLLAPECWPCVMLASKARSLIFFFFKKPELWSCMLNLLPPAPYISATNSVFLFSVSHPWLSPTSCVNLSKIFQSRTWGTAWAENWASVGISTSGSLLGKPVQVALIKLTWLIGSKMWRCDLILWLNNHFQS